MIKDGFIAPRYSKTLTGQVLHKITQKSKANLNSELDPNFTDYIINPRNFGYYKAPFQCIGCGVKFTDFYLKRFHDQNCMWQPSESNSSAAIASEIQRVRSIEFLEKPKIMKVKTTLILPSCDYKTGYGISLQPHQTVC